MKNISENPIYIIGGGIIGLTLAFTLLQKNARVKITIIEKESDVGLHQSGRNSGVLHAGLHYKPGSLKAQLSTLGLKKMVDFCKTHHIPFEICGKLVVATSENEIPDLLRLKENGEKNGLKNLHFIDNIEVRKIEPHLNFKKVLSVPEEGIIDYKLVTQKLKDLLKQSGVTFLFNTDISHINSLFDNSKCLVINCAGLYSDLIYEKLTNVKSPVRIIPFRGDYYFLGEQASEMINHLIYPVPNPKFPFLGVHFTKLIHGGIEAGPNAALAFKREGYHFSDFNINEFSKTLQWLGFWKFIVSNFGYSINELHSSISKSAFLKRLQRFYPELQQNDLIEGFSGVRAQAIKTNGELEMDFVVKRFENQIHVLNAPSPGATASFAISEWIMNHFILSK